MASNISRTVQYWMLTDGRTHNRVTSVDWPAVFRGWQMAPPVIELEGFKVQGIPYYFDDDEAGVGLTISKNRDHVPKQGNFVDGNRSSVGVNEGWSAIDDLFVYFTPVRGVIAMLAESQSSVRIGKFVEWLQKALPPATNDPDFFWGYRPVLDTLRRKQLDHANGLKMFRIGGILGGSQLRQPGFVASLFGGEVERRFEGLRVEIKVSRDRLVGEASDETALLQFLEEHFGQLDHDTTISESEYTTFQVKASGASNEVDLIRQRLTRKKNVQLSLGASRAIFDEAAFAALEDAFKSDHDAILEGITE